MYGYEMIENLRKKSNDVFELKAGTLYPFCIPWNRGYLTSSRRGRFRKGTQVYSITGEGKRYPKGKEEYAGAVSGVLSHCIVPALGSTSYLRQGARPRS